MAYACQHRTLKPLENSYIIISYEGAYELGLVLLLRCGLCLSINLFLSPMKAFTN